MKVHKNILSKKERLKILKFIKTVIKDLGPNFPGLQSEATLHGCKKLEKLFDKINVIIKGYKIHRCWANFSNGNYRDNVVHYISNSYIIQYKRTYSDNSFFGYNINYDFNSDSLLLKETRNYFGDQQYNYNSKKIELIYEYE